MSSQSGPLDVSTYADRQKQEKRRQMWGNIAAGLAAGANSYSASMAGYQSTSGTYSGTTNVSAYGSGGRVNATGTTHGTYSGTTYNSSAAFQAQQSANANNQALFDRQRVNSDFAQRDLEARALKINTLSSGEFVMGDVAFALPKKNKSTAPEFTVTVDVAGEPVVFVFRERQ